MSDPPTSRDDQLERSFIRPLVEDVLAARERLILTDSQGNRRDIVRATFAAIEGATWIYREHVREVTRDMGLLTPTADLALRERTFSVSDRGDIIEQVRFVTLPTIIRLATKQAALIDAAAVISFDGQGWSALRSAIDVRHRITHPKGEPDLNVSEADIDTVTSAFMWLLQSTEAVMLTINKSFRAHITDIRDVAHALASGDQQAIADYRAALLAGDDV